MVTMRTLTITIALTLLLSTTAYAGNINTNDAPGDIGSVMYTLNQIYEKVTSGTTPAAKTAGFKEPAVGPAGTMYTLDNIEAKIAAGTTTAAAGDVLDGKTFITRTAGSGESALTGIAAAGANVIGGDGVKVIPIPNGLYSGGDKTATANDTNLVEGNIASGTTIFGVAGTLSFGLADVPTFTASTVGADHIATDNGTGLVWAAYDTEAGCNGGVALAQAAAITYCDGLTFATKSDWRLPNIKELVSIVDYTIAWPGPTIDMTIFTSAKNQRYWSSTTLAGSADSAWGVNFVSGGVVTSSKTGTFYVRAVRGG